MLLSKPISLDLKDGIRQSSAERKSPSQIPYFSLSTAITLSFTRSFSSLSASYGREPRITLRFSPSIAFAIGFDACSLARCGRRSVMQKQLSFSSSPQQMSTLVPSSFTTEP